MHGNRLKFPKFEWFLNFNSYSVPTTSTQVPNSPYIDPAISLPNKYVWDHEEASSIFIFWWHCHLSEIQITDLSYILVSYSPWAFCYAKLNHLLELELPKYITCDGRWGTIGETWEVFCPFECPEGLTFFNSRLKKTNRWLVSQLWRKFRDLAQSNTQNFNTQCY